MATCPTSGMDCMDSLSIHNNQSPLTRGDRRSTGKSSVDRRDTQPTAGCRQRPSSGQVQDFLSLPKVGSGVRPGAGSPPGASQLPGLDRGKIRDSIGVGVGQRPSMPEWFQPGASQLPSTRPGGDRPAMQPPGGDRPPAAGQLPSRSAAGDRPGRSTAKPPVPCIPSRVSRPRTSGRSSCTTPRRDPCCRHLAPRSRA